MDHSNIMLLVLILCFIILFAISAKAMEKIKAEPMNNFVNTWNENNNSSYSDLYNDTCVSKHICGEEMLELIQKIKLYTEAGIILEHMELFDELENCISNFKTQTKQRIFNSSKANIVAMSKNNDMLIEAEIRMRIKKELIKLVGEKK